MLKRIMLTLLLVLSVVTIPIVAGDSSKDPRDSKSSKDSDNSDISCNSCDGKINTLTLQYNGDTAATIDLYDFKKNKISSQVVKKYHLFTLNGFDKKATLGPKINLYIDGVLNTQIHTSCSVELLVGMSFGDFTIKEGTSRNGGAICTIDDYKPTANLCGKLYEDKNLNGVIDSDEKGAANIVVTMIASDGQASYATTDATGEYCAKAVAEGITSIQIDTTTLPLGTIITSGANPQELTISALENNYASDIGYALVIPTANPSSYTTAEDTPIGVTLTGSDKLNLPLTYTLTTHPSHGTLSGTAPTLTYTPDADYNGDDSFSFKSKGVR